MTHPAERSLGRAAFIGARRQPAQAGESSTRVLPLERTVLPAELEFQKAGGTVGRGTTWRWPSQPAEDRIGPREVGGLERAWSFDGASVGIESGTRSTPIVANGCVYVAFGMGYLGPHGHVVALNADTGALVWHHTTDGSVLGLAAANGMVYVTPSRGTRGDVSMPVVTGDYAPAGSYAMALDAATGEVRWTSSDLDDGNATNGTFVNASPVVYSAGGRDLLFVPLAGGGGDGARVPMYFIDALTGEIVRRAFSLSDDDYAKGYGGTGIWSTAAYDRKTQHLYVGTADSDGHSRQHRYNNAILRIDANPKSPRFSSVVDSYGGTTEHADLDPLVGGEANPLYGLTGDAIGVDPPTFFDTLSLADVPRARPRLRCLTQPLSR